MLAYVDGTDPGRDGVGAMGITAGSVALSASDVSSIAADVAAVSVAVSLSPIGAAISVGISTAANLIDNDVEAYATSARIGTTTGDLSYNFV